MKLITPILICCFFFTLNAQNQMLVPIKKLQSNYADKLYFNANDQWISYANGICEIWQIRKSIFHKGIKYKNIGKVGLINYVKGDLQLQNDGTQIYGGYFTYFLKTRISSITNH